VHEDFAQHYINRNISQISSGNPITALDLPTTASADGAALSTAAPLDDVLFGVRITAIPAEIPGVGKWYNKGAVKALYVVQLTAQSIY
jgi:hypothetical protein